MESFKRILPVFAVLFLGYLGFSLALPIFPPLFLDYEHSFLPLATSTTMRRVLLGVLFAMYPSGQFIGAPIMGKLSDKYGRKPILLISLLAIIPAYIGCALAVSLTVPFLLYLSRFLCGLFEGNITIAQAAVSDTSQDSHTKTKNFGWLVSLSSSAFLLGPLIGGKLADSSLISWFHYDTPFWCAALLVLIGFFIVLFLFKETHSHDPEIKVNVKKLFTSFLEGLKVERLKGIFAANLCVYLGIFFFLNFFSAFLVNAFHFNVSRLGEANAYLALFLVAAPFLFGSLSKIWSAQTTMLIGSFLFSASLIVFILPSSPWALLLTLIPVGVFMAIGFAFPAIMISDNVSKSIQGQALGTNQAIQVFAEGVTALLGGVLMAISNTFPIWMGAMIAVIAGIILLRLKVKSAFSS